MSSTCDISDSSTLHVIDILPCYASSKTILISRRYTSMVYFHIFIYIPVKFVQTLMEIGISLCLSSRNTSTQFYTIHFYRSLYRSPYPGSVKAPLNRTFFKGINTMVSDDRIAPNTEQKAVQNWLHNHQGDRFVAEWIPWPVLINLVGSAHESLISSLSILHYIPGPLLQHFSSVTIIL